jgi:hypothetical protein
MFRSSRFVFYHFGLNLIFVFPSFHVGVARTCILCHALFRGVYCTSAKHNFKGEVLNISVLYDVLIDENYSNFRTYFVIHEARDLDDIYL